MLFGDRYYHVHKAIVHSVFYECLSLATREQWQVKTRRKNAKPQKDLKGNIKKSIDEAEVLKISKGRETPH